MRTDQAVAPQFKRDLNTDIYPYTSRDMSPEDGYVTVRCSGRGVDQSHVSQIKRRVIWKHVNLA